MALVPYTPTRKRVYGDGNIPNWGRLFRPYTGSAQMAVTGYRRSATQGRGNRYGRRRYQDPFMSIMRTRTDPVYPRPEVKWIDVEIGSIAAPTSIDSSGTTTQTINVTTQGTGNSARLGSQIAVKSVYYQFVLNFGTGATPNVLRHILYWDRQSNSATASAATVLSATALVTSPMNLQFRERFVILADDRITLSPNGEQIKVINGFRKINQLANYNSASTTPQNGALNVLFISDESVAANEPTIYGTWRVRFMDC